MFLKNAFPSFLEHLPSRLFGVWRRRGRRWFGILVWCGLQLVPVCFGDPDAGVRFLVVGIGNFHPKTDYLAVSELETIIGEGVNREPKAAVDLVAPGFENRIFVILCFRDAFPFYLYNLQIPIVDPDTAKK